MECTKIILASYKKLDALIGEIDERVEKRCVYSYLDRTDCETIAVAILKMMKRKNDIVSLKKKVDLVFSLLSDEERDLLKLKYFDENVERKFDFCLRTYFRKQARLLKKLDEYFSFIGISDENFFSTFGQDKFFTSAKIKTEDIKRLACRFNDGFAAEKTRGRIGSDCVKIA